MAMRQPLDSILNNIFGACSDCGGDTVYWCVADLFCSLMFMFIIKFYSLEARVKLLWPSAGDPRHADADGVVAHNLSVLENHHAAQLRSLSDADWCGGAVAKDYNYWPMLAGCEIKAANDVRLRMVGERQLAMTTATGLYHRLSLGITEEEDKDKNVVCGLLQTGNQLQLYKATTTSVAGRQEIVSDPPKIVQSLSNPSSTSPRLLGSGTSATRSSSSKHTFNSAPSRISFEKISENSCNQ